MAGIEVISSPGAEGIGESATASITIRTRKDPSAAGGHIAESRRYAYRKKSGRLCPLAI